MNNPYFCFKIRNLTRIFGSKLAVYVPKLDIQAGKFIMIVGDSGAGKTTFLETLGLLSQAYDTRISNSQIVYYPSKNDKGYDYRDLWIDEKKLNKVRLEHMSFMFQDSNLLPFFDIVDNIAMISVIDGATYQNARDNAINKLSTVIQPQDLMNSERIPYENIFLNTLSAGQKQRCSFARASVKNFRVIFADEPTGNIGIEDSYNLLSLVRSKIDDSNDCAEKMKNDDLRKTAIFVTHNLRLALTFADQIIVLNKNGFISSENIFSCDVDIAGTPILQKSKDIYKIRSWQKLGCTQYEMIETLSNIMNNNAIIKGWETNEQEITTVNGNLFPKVKRPQDVWNIFSPILDNKKAEEQLTDICKPDEIPDINKNYDAEFKSLYLKANFKDLQTGSRNSIFMMIILLIVFLAIGFGRGGLDVLKDKMKKPFIRWVDVSTTKTNDDTNYIIGHLNSATMTDSFNIENVSGFNRFGQKIWNDNKNGIHWAFGCTITKDSPLLEELTNKQNLLYGGKFNDEKSLGWIVSEEFIEKYCVDINPAFVKMVFTTREGDFIVPIPVVGIVKHLPGNVKFISTQHYYTQYSYSSDNPFNPENTRELVLFTEIDEVSALSLRNKLKNFFLKHKSKYGNFRPHFADPQEYNQSWRKGFEIRCSFRGDINYNFLENVFTEIRTDPDFKMFDLIRLSTPKECRILLPIEQEYLSIYFKNLNMVEEFRDYLLKEFLLEIDMAKVESFKNYKFITNLTIILGSVIIIISILSFSIYIANIMAEHLHKNRIFIGIFTAFGITDQTMQRIYQRIMVPFIAINVFIAFIVALIIGYSGFLKFVISTFGLDGETDHIYFNLYNFQLVVFIVVMLLSSTICVRIVAKNYLDHSPGDLIYDRIGNDKRTSPPVQLQKRRKKLNACNFKDNKGSSPI